MGTVLLAVTVLVVATAFPHAAAAEVSPDGQSTLIKITNLDDISPVLIDPTGIAYMPDSATLVIADSEIDEEPSLFDGFNMAFMGVTSGATRGGVAPAANGRLEPTGLAYDPTRRTLFVTNDSTDEVAIVERGPDGKLGTADDVVTVPDYSTLDLRDLEDAAYDINSGHLLLLEGSDGSVYRISPGPDGTFNGLSPSGDDTVSLLSLPSLGILDATGLEFVASTDSLLVTDRQKDAVFEVSANGNLVRQIDLSFLKVPGVTLAPSDVAIGPASDGSGQQRLYVVDRGADNGDPDDAVPAPRDGRLIELAVEIGGGRFTDDNESIFQADIEWLADEGITAGCNPPANDRFCPNEPVTRGQMAAFLVRALNLPAATSTDVFVDDDTSVFEADIDRLAASEITRGCNPPRNDRFCPDSPVTRDQMAAFLVRAMGYSDAHHDLFIDDDGSVFEADINKLASADVTRGCNPPANTLFCPTQAVTRGQMAAFLHRALGD